MIYINSAKMDTRNFYIQIRQECLAGLRPDRVFVFATTNDQNKVGWAFKRSKNNKKGGEKDASIPQG